MCFSAGFGRPSPIRVRPDSDGRPQSEFGRIRADGRVRPDSGIEPNHRTVFLYRPFVRSPIVLLWNLPVVPGPRDPPVRPNLAEPARPPESGRTRPSVRIRPNSDWGRPSESGRTQIWDGRPNPAELRLGTAARIRPKNI